MKKVSSTNNYVFSFLFTFSRLSVKLSVTLFFKIRQLTRIYSSRMRTARFNGHLWGWGCVCPGVCVSMWCVCVWVCVSGGVCTGVGVCLGVSRGLYTPAPLHAGIHTPSAQLHAGILPPAQLHAGIHPTPPPPTGQNE